MMGLTVKQRELLEFLRTHNKTHGVTPSRDKIMVTLGLSSKSGVSRLIDGLEERGHICRPYFRSRNIEILKAEYHDPSDCLCGPCAGRRYQEQLKLVQALHQEPPSTLRSSFCVGFRIMSRTERFRLLGMTAPKTAAHPRATIPTRAI